MNKKIYKRLMIAGLLPWRPDVLKKSYILSQEQRLLRDGWCYVDSVQPLSWKDQTWTLLYKVVDTSPRPLPGFCPIDVDIRHQYRYLEFMAVNSVDRHVELYAYGNFIRGKDDDYVQRGRQLIRV